MSLGEEKGSDAKYKDERLILKFEGGGGAGY
jgi:hypothetical protein